MLKPTIEDMRDLLGSTMIAGEPIANVTYEHMAKRPAVRFNLSLRDNRTITLDIPHMRLDLRKPAREDNRY